jgi:hypothetical protein
MENLVLDASDKTPFFILKQNGEFQFGGISMPEDAASFYFKIIDWITDYYRTPSKETFITVSFRYLNSSSSSMVLKIFNALKNLQDSGKTTVKCTWFYEDGDIDMKEYVDQIKKYADNIAFEVQPKEEISDRFPPILN